VTELRGGQGAGLAVRLCLVAKARVFGGQLAMLEGILGPLAGWSKAWAEFEGLVMNARRDPGPEG
jgi:hypothetical protein